MLLEINQLLEKYDYIIKFAWAAFPFVITIIIAYFTCEQYKLSQYKEYCKFSEEFGLSLKKPVEEKFKEIKDILSSKEKNKDEKQREVLELVESIASLTKKYEPIIEHSDVTLINESYKKLTKWIETTKDYTWNKKEIWQSFLVISEFLSYVLFIDTCYMNKPNKTITIYNLIGKIIVRIYKFVFPYWLQKFIKKYFCPFLLRVAILFIILYYSLHILLPLIGIFIKLPAIIFSAIISVFIKRQDGKFFSDEGGSCENDK